MTFENMNTDDFFPLLQQTLSDTFKIDSYLMHAPYQNFEKMDMGLRRDVYKRQEHYIAKTTYSHHNLFAEIVYIKECQQ